MFKENKFTEYLLIYILVFLPVTNWTPIKRELYYFSFILALFFFIKKGIKINITFTKVLILISLILILQTLYFGKMSFVAIAGLYMSLTLPYFAVRIFEKDYIKIFINIVTAICVVSLIFYLPSLFFPSFHNIIGTIAPSLHSDVGLMDQNFLIYTWEEFSSNGLLRNSGNFTEAGVFACYLNLALVFNLVSDNKIINKKNIILFICIITTFSTAGYIALYFIGTFYYISVEKSAVKYLLIPIVIVFALYTYKSLDFMQTKIQGQYDTQVNDKVQKGRFGSTMADLDDFIKYPILGRGIIKSTRFDNIDTWEGDNAPRPILNSYSDLLVKMGIIGFSLYFYWLYNSINYFSKKMNFKKNAVYLVIGTLIIVLSAQSALTSVFFWSLLYLKDIEFAK